MKCNETHSTNQAPRQSRRPCNSKQKAPEKSGKEGGSEGEGERLKGGLEEMGIWNAFAFGEASKQFKPNEGRMILRLPHSRCISPSAPTTHGQCNRISASTAESSQPPSLLWPPFARAFICGLFIWQSTLRFRAFQR